MYKSLKKLVSLVVILSTVLSVSSIASALDLPSGTAVINVTSATPSFDPTVGERGFISYEASGDSTVQGISVRIYKPSSTGCDTTSNYVALIKAPTNEPAKNAIYSVSWDGKDQTGVITGTPGKVAPVGTYCYRVQWANFPIGQSKGYVESLIRINSTSSSGSPGSYVPPSGTGGSVAGLGTLTNACGVTGTGPLTVSVNPDTIDPKKGGVSYLCYYANQNLSSGFNLYIYNSAGAPVWTKIKGTTSAGQSELISWNGTYNSGSYTSGSYVPLGSYLYKFYVSGQVVAQGSINIIDQGGGGVLPPDPQPSGADITFWVDPSTILIDSATKQTLQPSSLTYVINRRVTTGLTVYIRDGLTGSPIRSLLIKSGTLEPGSYLPVTWDGKYSNGTAVPAGPYKFVLSSAGVDIDYWDVAVQYVVSPPEQGPFIVSNSASPTSFTKPNYTTINFTTGKPVSNFRISVKNQAGSVVDTLYSRTSLAAGSYSTTWSGPANLTGTQNYTYTFEASNESPIFGGNVSVTSAAVAPFIISNVASPQSFYKPNSTTITFTTGKTVSNFSIRVRNEAGSVIDTLFATPTLYAGTYSTVWTGGNETVSSGSKSYPYFFEATNESPALGGAITLLASPIIPPASFIVSHSVNPQTFNPFLNERTTINFTTGKTVSNFRITIKNQLGSTVATLFSNPTLAMGTYNVSWYGTSNEQDANPARQGTYTYTFEATNETPVLGGNIIVLGSAGQNAPVISDFGPAVNSFNPTAGETITLRFQVNQDARADVYILNQNNVTVRRLLTSNNVSNNVNANVTNSLTWRGKDFEDTGANSLPSGNYTYFIEARNANGTATTKTGTIFVGTGGGSQLMDVSNLSAASFNPEVADAALKFFTNRDANVTIKLYRPDGSFLKTLRNNQFYSAGSNIAYWDGTDAGSTNYVAAGNYRFTVDASSSQYGFDSESATVTVLRTGGGSQLMDVSNVFATSFNPKTTSGTLNFTLNRDADVTVTIYRPNGSLLRTLASNKFYSSGSRSITWDGRESSGSSNYAAAGTYRFSVEATSATYGYDSESAYVVVLGTTTPPVVNCGNFSDVNASNSLCPAIEFVKARGIFAGYSDGTLRPDAVINRVELLAVMQKAFRFSLDSYDPVRDGTLGFTDLYNSKYEWYMPYVKTFKRLGLISGYPDGTLRPERTMNTAELYTVLLKAAQRAGVANFVIDADGGIYRPPFIDTPIHTTTRWYIKYAEFAQLNDLVTTERFYPERGISRGQVIKLIYDTHRKNLINYGGSYVTNGTTGTTTAGNVQITNLSSPSFNPDSRTGTITFSLNRPSSVTLNVYKPDGTFLKTLYNNQNYGSGSQTLYWDGKDANNVNYVPAGMYKYTLLANSSQYGSDTETGYITVSRTGTTSGNVDTSYPVDTSTPTPGSTLYWVCRSSIDGSTIYTTTFPYAPYNGPLYDYSGRLISNSPTAKDCVRTTKSYYDSKVR